MAAVYDGHGDSTVSIYLKENLLKKIANHEKFASSPAEAITECTFPFNLGIKQIEEEVIERFDSTSGSTLMIVLWK